MKAVSEMFYTDFEDYKAGALLQMQKARDTGKYPQALNQITEGVYQMGHAPSTIQIKGAVLLQQEEAQFLLDTVREMFFAYRTYRNLHPQKAADDMARAAETIYSTITAEV